MARFQVELSIIVRNASNGTQIISDSVVYEADAEVLKRLPMSQAVQEMVNVLLAGQEPEA